MVQAERAIYSEKGNPMRVSMNTLSKVGVAAFALAVSAAPAFAEEAAEDSSAFTITGGATLVSDYRFRGVSLSAEDPTLQGSITVAHESGFYVSTWGSGLASGTPYGGSEIDLIGGWGGKLGGLTVDVNATYYAYPNKSGAAPVEYVEFLASAAKDIGPVNAKLGVAFAPKQKSLGSFSTFYIYNDYALGIPSTPFKLKAHIGYNKSDFFVDPKAIDYSIGAEASWKALTFGVSYVNTNIKPKLAREAIGADGTVLFTLGAAF
jgi:uncharacterized protein (TIGR02001 family)